MDLISQISEDEIIAEFLKAEINSPRFRDEIIAALNGIDDKLITQPNLHSDMENRLRKEILGKVRGYGQNRDLFENFPSDVTWYRANIHKAELHNVMYIDYSYWNALSNNTRLPIHARANILKDVRVFDVSNQGFFEIHSLFKKGVSFPRLILVSMNPNTRIVVLEGHARLTGYFLEPKLIPETMEVMIGYSEDFRYWGLY
ncbi:MAG: hypothetical protein ACOX6S_04760 [Clostridia bacterium]|jgi:hypothetical protein